jgi:hypothetical protein
MSLITWLFSLSKLFLIFTATKLIYVYSLEPGTWRDEISSNENRILYYTKSLYNQSILSIRIECWSRDLDIKKDVKIEIGWVFRVTECGNEYEGNNQTDFDRLYSLPGPREGERFIGALRFPDREIFFSQVEDSNTQARSKMLIDRLDPHGSHSSSFSCSHDGTVLQLEGVGEFSVPKPDITDNKPNASAPLESSNAIPTAHTETNKRVKRSLVQARSSPINMTNAKPSSLSFGGKADSEAVRTTLDGVYLLLLQVKCPDTNKNCAFAAIVDVEMMHSSGVHLSAAEWPLLPFYMGMSVLYVLMAITWLTMLGFYWRDLVRLQYWIGAVLMLGMVEKTLFLAEFEHLNMTGDSVLPGMLIVAESVSALKRTLARILVLIVAVGFGYVKPRLEPLLVRKMAATSIIYFACAVIEGSLRSIRNRADVQWTVMAVILPLSLIDAILVLWIMGALVNTMRALRIRNNLGKLSLYRQFTLVLAFGVVVSVVFMIWSMMSLRTGCVTEWKSLWIDEAFWHLLFSFLLGAIMFLWRPSQNSLRFEPASKLLLDAEEGEEEEITMSNLADDIKVRKNSQADLAVADDKRKKKSPNDSKTDEDLRWVEENIPMSTEAVLPALIDSDEERRQAQFERSKLE